MKGKRGMRRGSSGAQLCASCMNHVWMGGCGCRLGKNARSVTYIVSGWAGVSQTKGGGSAGPRRLDCFSLPTLGDITLKRVQGRAEPERLGSRL